MSGPWDSGRRAQEIGSEAFLTAALLAGGLGGTLIWVGGISNNKNKGSSAPRARDGRCTELAQHTCLCSAHNLLPSGVPSTSEITQVTGWSRRRLSQCPARVAGPQCRLGTCLLEPCMSCLWKLGALPVPGAPPHTRPQP